MNPTELLAWACALAAVVATLDVRRARWTWLACAAFSAGWLAANGSLLVGGALIAGAVIATMIDVPDTGVALTFSTVISRMSALLASITLALLLTSRLLFTGLVGQGAATAFILAAGAAFLVHLVTLAPAERSYTARVLAVIAAIAWSVVLGGEAQVPVLVVAGVLVLVALVRRVGVRRILPGPAAPLLAILGGGAVAVSLGGPRRGAAVLVVAAAAVALVIARSSRDDESTAEAGWLAIIILVLVAVPNPLIQFGAVVALSYWLTISTPEASVRLWRPPLLAGATLIFIAVLASEGGNMLPPRAAGIIATLGQLALAGSLPFGVTWAVWWSKLKPPVALVVMGAMVPVLLALVMVGSPGGFKPAGFQSLLSWFGAATALAGGIYALESHDFKDLAFRGAWADIGFVLVGIGAADARGLQGAALSMTALLLTRGLMILLSEDSGPGDHFGRWVATMSAMAAPPTIAFAARLLIIGAAYRVSAALAAVVVAASVLSVGAALKTFLRGARRQAGAGNRLPAATVVAMSTLVLATGVAPGLLLRYQWGLG